MPLPLKKVNVKFLHLYAILWLLDYCLFENLKVQNASGYVSSPSPHSAYTYLWVLRGWNINQKEMDTHDRNRELCCSCSRFGVTHSSLVQFENRETFLLSLVCVILAWEFFKGWGKELLFQGHKSRQNETKSWDNVAADRRAAPLPVSQVVGSN